LAVMSVIAVAAVAGVGFATYTSTANTNVSVNAGSFYIVASATLVGSSLAVGTCSVIVQGTSVEINATNMLPGDYCNWTNQWVDAGTIGGNLVSWSPAYMEGNGCSQLAFYAPWTNGPNAYVAPGGIAGAGYWLVTDVGNGAVAGTCQGSVSMTYAPA